MVTYVDIDVHGYDVYTFMFMLVLVQYFKWVLKTASLLFSFFFHVKIALNVWLGLQVIGLGWGGKVLRSIALLKGVVDWIYIVMGKSTKYILTTKNTQRKLRIYRGQTSGTPR